MIRHYLKQFAVHTWEMSRYGLPAFINYPPDLRKIHSSVQYLSKEADATFRANRYIISTVSGIVKTGKSSREAAMSAYGLFHHTVNTAPKRKFRRTKARK